MSKRARKDAFRSRLTTLCEDYDLNLVEYKECPDGFPSPWVEFKVRLKTEEFEGQDIRTSLLFMKRLASLFGTDDIDTTQWREPTHDHACSCPHAHEGVSAAAFTVGGVVFPPPLRSSSRSKRRSRK